MDKETPITKYLATLERRQAQRERELFGSPSPGVSPESRNIGSIRQQLRFDDETFLQPHDQSILPFHPSSAPFSRNLLPTPTNNNTTATVAPNTSGLNLIGSRSGFSGGGSRTTTPFDRNLFSNGFKRKRYSFEDDREEEEDKVKKICELERLLRQTTGELVEARSMTAKLERQKMELRTEGYDKALKFEKSATEMKIKTRDAIEKAEEVLKENERNRKKLEELKDELRRQSVASTDKILTLESKVSQLQSENVQLKQNYEEDKMNQSDTMQNISKNLQDSEKSSDKWSVECQILKDQLALKDTQLAKYQEELKDAQSKIFKYDELQNKLGQLDSSEAQTLALQNEIKRYENLYVQQQNENNGIAQQLAKLSEENGYFKSSMNKEMLLEEQIASLDSEVNRLREMLNSKSGVEVERDALKDKLFQWTQIGEAVNSEFFCPKKFRMFMSQTQTELFELKEENTTLKCKIDEVNSEIARVKAQIAEANSKEATSKEELDKLTTEMQQQSRRFTLLTKDRDGLKSLKESYEQELEGIISAALKERVIQLESLVSEYEQIVNADPTSSKACRECSMRMALISDLRSELERAKSQPDASVMGDVTMNDDGNTTGIKIVTFGMNPSMMTLEGRIKELSIENDNLKEKLKQLEDQSILAPSDAVIDAGKKLLEEQLRNLERKHELLTQAYNYETQQLQTAVSKLFGFNLVLIREPQPQFRMHSVYATSPGPEEELVFQEAENADMMLLETPILDNFREDIDRYLVQEGSIPSFLSAVTIAFSKGNIGQVDSSQLLGSQQGSASAADTGDGDGDTITSIHLLHNKGKMVQVEIEGQSEEDEGEEEGSEAEEEEAEEEEDEEMDEDNEENRPYTDEEEETEEEDEQQRDDDSDGDVVCIDSD